MSRREYDDYYYERDRDYRERRPRRHYDEVEIDIERERVNDRPRRAVSVDVRKERREPEFLREDYKREEQGPLVLREREVERVRDYQAQNGRTDVSVAGSRRRGDPRAEEIARADISVSGRSRRGELRVMREEDDRRSIRRGSVRGDLVDERIVVDITERDDSPPPRRKELVDDDAYSRRGEQRPPERREIERERIVIEADGLRSGKSERAKSERGISPGRSVRDYQEEDVYVRDYDRRRGPPRARGYGPALAREREEFVFRTRRSPSPPSDIEQERITIRTREASPPPREPSPESEPEPEPEPPAPPVAESVREVIRVSSPEIEPYTRPPIVQHIYTHHHHIDHGLSRARARSPSSASSSSVSPTTVVPAPAPAEKTIEVEIERRGIRNGQQFYEKDKIIEKERDKVEQARSQVDNVRRKSVSVKSEARRDSGRPLRRDMWTEVTKDLVIEEAIKEAGYGFEESANHYYVMEYLKYEDVVRLVEISDRILNERARDKKWRMEEFDRASATGGKPRYEERERIIEREIVRDYPEGRRGSRYR